MLVCGLESWARMVGRWYLVLTSVMLLPRAIWKGQKRDFGNSAFCVGGRLRADKRF